MMRMSLFCCKLYLHFKFKRFVSKRNQLLHINNFDFFVIICLNFNIQLLKEIETVRKSNSTYITKLG